MGGIFFWVFIFAFWPEISEVLGKISEIIGQIPGDWNRLKGVALESRDIWIALGEGFRILQEKLFSFLEVIRSFSALILNLFFNIVFFGTGLLIASQLILPVRTLEERRKIFNRIWCYVLGIHGLAVIVREGKEISRFDEQNTFLPGVIAIDLCSAVALQKRPTASLDEEESIVRSRSGKGLWWLVKFPFRFPSRVLRGILQIFGMRRYGKEQERVRVVGPGIVFTERGESIHGVADLRRQFRITVPVKSATRDGFDIESPVFVIFSLGEPPDILKVTYVGEEGADHLCVVRVGRDNQVLGFDNDLDEQEQNEIHYFVQNNRPPFLEDDSGIIEPDPPCAPYILDKDRVFAALYGRTHHVTQDVINHWSELPALVANELVRDLLSVEDYSDLYRPDIPGGDVPGSYPFGEVLRPRIGRIMQRSGVLSYQFARRRDGRMVRKGDIWDGTYLEIYPIRRFRSSRVLRDLGIKVIFSGLPQLNITHSGIREQLLDYWRARWQRRADVVESQLALEAMRIQTEARMETQERIINTLSRLFDLPDISREALAIQIFQALDSFAADPKTRALLPETAAEYLRDIRQYLLP